MGLHLDPDPALPWLAHRLLTGLDLGLPHALRRLHELPQGHHGGPAEGGHAAAEMWGEHRRDEAPV